MTAPIKLDWRWRETRDSEYATARYRGFDIQVQDCDGDLSRWHIKRGDQYIAMGETDGNEQYHMDVAMAQAAQVMGYIWGAVDMNDYVRIELPRLKAQGLA